jgi:Saxitoxin biosynthesis operon protein SxtJ
MKAFFYKLKRIWLSFAQKLGKANTIVLLTVIYLIVIGPMALIVRLLRKDPLRKKKNPKLATYWLNRISSEQTVERQKFQF